MRKGPTKFVRPVAFGFVVAAAIVSMAGFAATTATTATTAATATTAIAAIAAIAASSAEDRKGPAYLLITGEDLEAPVVVHHESADLFASNQSDLSRLFRGVGEVVSAPRSTRYYDVYEFWPGPPTPPANADGTPSAPLDPELADSVSRIYPDEPGGPVWNPDLMPFGVREEGERPWRSEKDYRRLYSAELLEKYGLSIES